MNENRINMWKIIFIPLGSYASFGNATDRNNVHLFSSKYLLCFIYFVVASSYTGARITSVSRFEESNRE